MVNPIGIVSQVFRIISDTGTNFQEWTVGITAEPEERKVTHGSPDTWQQWEADSEEDARNIEVFLLKQDMKGGTGGGKNPRYVYIFQH